MQNNKEKFGLQYGCQQGCRQGPFADNQFEAQINRLKSIFNIRPGWGTDPQLAKNLKISRQAVSSWRKSGIPGKRLTEICDQQKILVDWLLTGQGPMRREGQSGQYPQESRRDVKGIKEKSAAYPMPTPHITVVIPEYSPPASDHFNFIPVTEALLSAGPGTVTLSEEIRGYYAFWKDWVVRIATHSRNLFLMNVEGTSMEPTIHDGDLVMIDIGRKDVHDGYIYALSIDDSIVVKRLEPLPGRRIRIISDNRVEYPSYEILSQDIRILGQVIWFAHELVKRGIE